MNINVKPKFGLRGVICRNSLVFLTLALLVSSLCVCVFTLGVEGQTLIHVGTEEDLINAVNNAENNVPVVIALDNNIALTFTLSIPANKNITLTSNGNSEFLLFGPYTATTIAVENRGMLTINGIMVTHVSGAGISSYGVTINYGGALTLSGGEIRGNNLGVSNSGTFDMYSGTISGNGIGVSNSDTFNMYGGIICENNGVGISNSGNCIIHDGTISDNKGGVSNRGGLGMTGGEISNNRAAGNGGGVYMNGGEFTMSGGRITANNVSNSITSLPSGGGIFINGGSFTMTGGEISDNTATNGGGVYINGNFNMTGGTISDNKATDGGGIYLAGGYVRLSGNSKISGNTASSNGGGVWVIDILNLGRLFVSNGVEFSNNSALAAYNRDPSHDDLYSAYIGNNTVWTSPFTQGYNNFDICYVYGTSITIFTVVVQDSFAENSGAGGYSEGETVTLNAGTRAGYTFYQWIVDGFVPLSSTTSATTNFTMLRNNVIVAAKWNAIQYSIDYTLNGGSATGNPSSYNAANSFPIALANPTRANYEFSGWNVTYANGTQTSFQVSYSIPEGTTGNIDLAANWRTPSPGPSSNPGDNKKVDEKSSSPSGTNTPSPDRNNGQPDNNGGVSDPRNTDNNDQHATDNDPSNGLTGWIATNALVVALLIIGLVLSCSAYFIVKKWQARSEQRRQEEARQEREEELRRQAAREREWYEANKRQQREEQREEQRRQQEEQEQANHEYTDSSADLGGEDPYDILGVEKTDPEEKVKNAWRAKCLSCYYDRLTPEQKRDPKITQIFHDEMCRVNGAWKEIKKRKGWT
jgi:uncharacterized repeat protein (TIGR02543 family)